MKTQCVVFTNDLEKLMKLDETNHSLVSTFNMALNFISQFIFDLKMTIRLGVCFRFYFINNNN